MSNKLTRKRYLTYRLLMTPATMAEISTAIDAMETSHPEGYMMEEKTWEAWEAEREEREGGP